MSILDRLGTVFKSYMNDVEAERAKSGSKRNFHSGRDPDLDAAFDELNDYLKNGGSGNFDSGGGYQYKARQNEKKQPSPNPQNEIAEAFKELGVPFGASAEECKSAYKKLLKIHHPDRHASHEGNFKKATARSARINAAYDKIEKWRNESR